MLLSLTRQVFFLVPLLLILPRFFGLTGILFTAPIADFIAFVTSGPCRPGERCAACGKPKPTAPPKFSPAQPFPEFSLPPA